MRRHPSLPIASRTLDDQSVQGRGHETCARMRQIALRRNDLIVDEIPVPLMPVFGQRPIAAIVEKSCGCVGTITASSPEG